MPRLVAICCSILCCLSLAWAMHREQQAPWQVYQQDYIRILRETADATAAPPGILEVRTEGFDVRRSDRCTTCHVALADPRFAGRRQPLSYHPPVQGHPEAAFTACTLCHLGNGRMLTAAGAHGIDPPAAEPRLDLRYVQASCLRCHERKDAGRITPKVAAGQRLFQADNCFGCHTIEGLSSGSVGPDLTEVGRRRSAGYLRLILTEPTMNNPHSPMPPTSPSRQEDLDCLVTFLLTLRRTPQPYAYQP